MRDASPLLRFSVIALIVASGALSACTTPTDEDEATVDVPVDTTSEELTAANESGLSLAEARAVVAFARTAGSAELEKAGLPPEASRAIVAQRGTRRVVTVRDVERIVLTAAPAMRTQSAASEALCARYRQLAGSNHMAALLCGTGPCWPASFWYGYWANLYTKLAESVCDDQ